MTSIAGVFAVGLVVLAWMVLYGPYATERMKASFAADNTKIANRPDIAAPLPIKKVGVTLAMTGDSIAHTSVVTNSKSSGGYDFARYFSLLRPLYADADIVFCNPETAVAGDEMGVTGYPSFNAPREFARDLAYGAGCNVINQATNHIADKGQRAIDLSRNEWDSLPGIFAIHGANRSAEEQRNIPYFEVNGIKFAFLAFADFSNAPVPHSWSLNTYHDTALTKHLITEAKHHAQVVIVSAHWGTEDTRKYNSDQLAAAELMAESGADLIIGTGPHMLQEAMKITASDGREVPVWYSLGNLFSTQLKIDELTGGIAKIKVTIEDGKPVFTDATFYPTFMSYDWPKADQAAEKIETRTNLSLTPLGSSQKHIQKLFPEESVDTRYQMVTETLEGNLAVQIVR